jgi:hypothetical protein
MLLISIRHASPPKSLALLDSVLAGRPLALVGRANGDYSIVMIIR